MTLEIRSVTQPVKCEKRADGQPVVSGYAAVFYSASDAGTEYELWDDMRERIMPGAFDRALRERQDVRALFNHCPDNLLGRSKSGTLRMSVDAKGLAYEIDLSESSACKDLVIGLDRKDIDGSSFSFQSTRATWTEEQRAGKTCWIRQVEDVDLFDVGPVTYPAYEATTSGLRSESRSSIQAERDAWLASRRNAEAETDADSVAVALALLNLDDE